MLEKPGLLLLPWSVSSPDLFQGNHPALEGAKSTWWTRKILEPHQGNCLGFACFSPSPNHWLPWWQRRSIPVFEGPDASLVLTLRRPWGFWRMWQVWDAEENRIGSFFRCFLLDGMGYFLAYLEEDSGLCGKILTRAGDELGSWELLPDHSSRLTFGPVAQANPFLRMILLGVVLSLETLPGYKKEA